MSKNLIPSELIQSIERFDKSSQAKIEEAYLFAFKKHIDQKRKSGEPYIIHPVKVAVYLSKDGFDPTCVIAALLHDTVEDTDTSFEELEKSFGPEISNIVRGVTKISTIKIKNKEQIFSDEELFLTKVDNYRKILLATISDLRVIIIKLYDRLHNIETIQYLPDRKKKFYARETIEIFAPIAERLGMGELKGKLEDLSFPFAYPEEYDKFIQTASGAYQNPNEVIQNIIPSVQDALQKNSISHHSISGRAKHLYSLFCKLKRKKDISFIFDIVALRVIVHNIEDCYKTLGIIHSLYKPIPGRIYDYIARPKNSGYQSLHTTVRDKAGNVFEIQIRTIEMHKVAEYGTAAHWNYKENFKNAAEWLTELKKIEEIQTSRDFIQTIKEELFSKKVFIFTPKGEIIDLPAGSTPVDFAYRIHTDVGNRCRGVKINGRIMPLKTTLETGDEVEILTSNISKPKEGWLKFVRTQGAKAKIRTAIRDLFASKYLEAGQKILDEAIKDYRLSAVDEAQADRLLQNSTFPYNTFEGALIALGQKNISKVQLLKEIYPGFSLNEEKKKKVPRKKTIAAILALKDIRHSFAGCCRPKTGQEMIGYLTRDHIIKVHKKTCGRLKSVDPDRLIKI